MQSIHLTQNQQDPKGKSSQNQFNLETIDTTLASKFAISEQDKLTNLITNPEESKMTMLFDSVFQINTTTSQTTSSAKKNKHRRQILLARSKKKMQDDEEDEIVFTQNLSTAIRGYAVSPKIFMKDEFTSPFSSFLFQSSEDKQSSELDIDNAKTFQFGIPDNDSKKDLSGPRRILTAKRRLKTVPKVEQSSQSGPKITENGGNSQKINEQTLSTGITTSTERIKFRTSKSEQNAAHSLLSRTSKYDVNLGSSTKPATDNIDDNIPVLQPSLKRSKRKKDQAFSTNSDQDDLPNYLEMERSPLVNAQAPREQYIPKSHLASQTRSRSILGAIDARMNAMGLGMRQTLQHSVAKYNQGRPTSSSQLPARSLDINMNDPKTTKSLVPFSTTYKHMISNHPNLSNESHIHQKDAWQQIIPLSRNLANEDKEQRQKFMNFWINLSDQQRRDLLKIDKESVLRKIKEQQRRTCSCNVCGRRRSAVERELEMLYDAYCREIQTQSNILERSQNLSETSDEDSMPESDDSEDLDIGKSLRVKGSLLVLDEDMVKHKGKKFLLLLDKLNSLERKLSATKIDNNNKVLDNCQSETTIGTRDDEGPQKLASSMDSDVDNDSVSQKSDDNTSDANSDNDIGHEDNLKHTDRDSDTEGELDNDLDISMATEQRIKEGRKMFQMFAAKMFEQRVYAAFKEVMAFHNQQKLIQEEEAAVRLQQAKKDAKSKKAKQKKQRKKQQKQLLEQVKKQQEEEERQQQEEQRRIKEEQEKIERDKRRQIEEIQRKEKERLQAEKLLKIAQQKEKEKKKQLKQENKEKEKEKEKNETPNTPQVTSGNVSKKKKKKKNTKQTDPHSAIPEIAATQGPVPSQQSILKQNSKNQPNKIGKKTPSKLNPNAAPYTLGRTNVFAEKLTSSTPLPSSVDDEDDDIANLLQNLIPAKLTLEDSSSTLGSSQDSWLLDEHASASLQLKFSDHSAASQNKTELSELTTDLPKDISPPSWKTADRVNMPDFIPVYSFPTLHTASNEQTWPQDTGVSLWTHKDAHPPTNHMNFVTWTPTWQSNLVPGNSNGHTETPFHFQPS